MTGNGLASNDAKVKDVLGSGLSVGFNVGELVDKGLEAATVKELKNEVRTKLGLPPRMTTKEKIQVICEKHKLRGTTASQVLYELQSKGLI